MKSLTASADSITLSSLGQNDGTFKPLKMAMKSGHFTDVYMLDLSPAYQPDGALSSDKLQEILQVSEQGGQQAFRSSFLRADGFEFPASISLKIFRLGDEDLTLSSIRDISKRVDAEGQLMQAQKMAAAAEYSFHLHFQPAGRSV